MRNLRLLLGDQLSHDMSSLRNIDNDHDVVLMLEVHEESQYVQHHKQKIILILAAMRHFAGELRERGIRVEYIKLDAPENTGSFDGEMQRAIMRLKPEAVVVTEPGEYRLLQLIRNWKDSLGIPVRVPEDDRFICSHKRFGEWASRHKQWRMEFFYRDMRRFTGWLMQDGAPIGGQWNFDKDNRQALPPGTTIPGTTGFAPDAITREVIALVCRQFSAHIGDAEPFRWPVTRHQALQALSEFVEQRLPRFGDYQDAMQTGEDILFHAALSPALNIGLLSAREVCEAAIESWQKGLSPLNAVEGFVRQILGWREYVRGIYWTCMPEYAEQNALGSSRALPAFYWDANTDLNCLKQCIGTTLRNAYAHHIQRLMVTGNFALLAGIHPREIERWYLAVYADAFEWVELPNTLGMVMHADGGRLGSKPYAASGSYINRMSDYCDHCRYDPAQKSGDNACPFNYLYWHFFLRHRDKFAGNPRLGMVYRNLERFDHKRIALIEEDSARFLSALR